MYFQTNDASHNQLFSMLQTPIFVILQKYTLEQQKYNKLAVRLFLSQSTKRN